MFRTLLIALCGLWLASATAGTATAQSEPVLQAQERLKDLGLSPGPIDGRMGPRTREALRAFQGGRGLPVTGELDWQTRTALGATMRAERRGPPAPVPRAVPVPDVLISELPAPGSEPAGSDGLAPVAAAMASPAPDSGSPDTSGTHEGQPAVILGPAPRSAPGPSARPPPAVSGPVGDDGRPAWLLWLAIGLGLTAAGAWIGLVMWWFRQRARRVAVD